MIQAYALYPGLYIEHADMVLSRGVQPSVCCLVAYPQSAIPPVADLQLIQAGGSRIVFKDCAVEGGISAPQTPRRGQRLRLKLYDRRWKWQFSRIDGEYNKPTPAGSIDSGTYEDYYNLIDKLLRAMGETTHSITLPEHKITPPYVKWSGANAATQLSRLLDRVGCTLVLGLDNRVYVMPVGVGNNIPTQGSETLKQFGSTRGVMPEFVTIVFANTRWQSRLKLEAVGMDSDGDIKKITDLKYKPDNGWEYEWPYTMPNVSTSSRPYALETVFRWYRVKSMGDGTLNLPGKFEVSSIEDIYPISNKLLTTMTSNKHNYAENANNIGTWYRGDLKGDNQSANSRLDVPFEIDAEMGIVKFAEPVFQLSSNTIKAATLYLTASYAADTIHSTGKSNYEKSIATNLPGAHGDAVLCDKTRFRSIIQNYSTVHPLSKKSVTDNRSDLDDFSIRHLLAYKHNFNTADQATMQWVGLEPVACTGHVRQVRWTVGYGVPMTYATWNVDLWTAGPTGHQLRMADEIGRLGDEGVTT